MKREKNLLSSPATKYSQSKRYHYLIDRILMITHLPHHIRTLNHSPTRLPSMPPMAFLFLKRWIIIRQTLIRPSNETETKFKNLKSAIQSTESVKSPIPSSGDGGSGLLHSLIEFPPEERSFLLYRARPVWIQIYRICLI